MDNIISFRIIDNNTHNETFFKVRKHHLFYGTFKIYCERWGLRYIICPSHDIKKTYEENGIINNMSIYVDHGPKGNFGDFSDN
jgi:hypothetical protein